ncbi:HrcA family transcriptional regulator [Mesomycoplasma hyopneumoniae]|uniref:Heat-inducible transcription repressor HrcA n=6 Tax=Mesomycoplasma hyopneumoniae TaxID=2099 RepID=HRCA_MESH2|nr:heat-inducible transcriptional repressor HrcA [Mesomycoplasma hyopneumoniae]Q4A902.1 RecName: Full=Heat-inducible transcription repressor HrcA [Mesomycoplasma hyopneumoniae 7448]Q4AAT9.1 RecName: Full=Heat-inducible transcription repressor HrcA [Mesomycoplasma hyopneumoniae J]Q602E0.1 RecName: Full=Heat-inducible transcription repressor HrcA [Mesomycoplasma hyopneumoniae 232]AAV27353.1 heat-inducible transcription repressor [Mesomycoplasma hyopneumoniae 232]AAZ44104.1 heat-inducible transcr
MPKLDSKKEKYLKQIVENFIKTGESIGSLNLKQSYGIKKSPSYLRAIMNQLEKEGFLEKSHSSSGRIPTLQGFQYYAEFLSFDENENLANKLKDLFARRRINIENTISEAVKLISESVGTTLIATTNNENERLMSINLTQISQNEGIIVVVSSSGNVENKKITFSEQIPRQDVKIAIRLFQERLINTPLLEISSKLAILKQELEKQIKHSDELLHHFMEKIFNFQVQNKSNIYNKNSLILDKEISRAKLVDLLYIIEKKSIWEMLEDRTTKDDDTLKISIKSPEVSFISKKFEKFLPIKEISMVGAAKKINYSAARTGIKLLEDFLSNKSKIRKG